MPQQGGLEMKKISVIFAGLIVLGLLCMVGIAAAQDTVTVNETDIPEYDGPIGADSPLYGLKLAWEDLDESFTTNETERVDKQMNHARIRISEARREFAENRTDTAQEALDQYWQKVNITQMRLAYFGANQTSLVHAQEMHEKHQVVLEGLMLVHPNNTGLARAYNNSLILEGKFEEKTQVRFEKTMAKNNQTIIKAYRIEVREENRAGADNETWNNNDNQVRNEDRGKTQDTVTAAPQQTSGQQDNNGKGKDKTTQSGTVSPQNDKPSDQGGNSAGNGQDNDNSNKDDKGNGNSKK